jgi:hypothetical protein
MLGQSTTAFGSVIHVIALAHAPVAIVQPLLAAELVVALGVRALWDRRRLTAVEIAGSLCTVGGLVVFLVAARPAPGRPGHLPSFGPVLLAMSISVALAVLSSRGRRGSAWALLCGAFAGIAAGMAATLASAIFKEVSGAGWTHAAGSAVWWTTVSAALLAGGAAQFGSQHAYARGALAWSLPALTVIDPLAAIPAAQLLLGERLEPGHAVVWAPAALVAVAGVGLLGRTDPVHRCAPAGDHRSCATCAARAGSARAAAMSGPIPGRSAEAADLLQEAGGREHVWKGGLSAGRLRAWGGVAVRDRRRRVLRSQAADRRTGAVAHGSPGELAVDGAEVGSGGACPPQTLPVQPDVSANVAERHGLGTP